MKNTLRFSLMPFIFLFLAEMLPARAESRQYQFVEASVPFKFTVGDRKFRPGNYQLVFLGPGLVALRDGRTRVVAATIMTRELPGAQADPAAASFRLVFKKDKKSLRLAEIWTGSDKPGLQVLGEETATRQNRNLGPPVIIPGSSFRSPVMR
jgi:hypothetical protein